MFRSMVRKLLSSRPRFRRGLIARKTKRDQRRKLLLEGLEDRRMFAVMVWENKFNDGFEAFGAQANVARNVVQAAIDTWANVIEDFNYEGSPNTFELTISAEDLPSEYAHGQFRVSDSEGKPHNGDIVVDTAPHYKGGGPIPWFFDPTPDNNSEFVGSEFAGTSTGLGADLYSVVLHEIGHTVGLNTTEGLALASFLTDTNVPHTDDGPRELWTYDKPGDSALTATFTLGDGGGHLYGGDPLAGLPTHPNDLMNRVLGPNTRRLVSPLDAAILEDAYGYTMNSTWSFADYAVENSIGASVALNNGVLTVIGSPAADNIILSRIGSNVNVFLNGVNTQYAVNSVSDVIQVLGRAGDDYITFDFSNGALAAGTLLIVNGGRGADGFYIEKSANGMNLSLNDNHLDYGSSDIYLNFVEKLEVYSSSGADTITVDNPTIALDSIRIDTRGGNDTVNLLSASENTDIVVNTGSDSDTVNLGQVGGDVVEIEGGLLVVGGTGSDQLNLHNAGVAGGRTYILNGNTLSHPGGDFEFSQFETITVNAGNGTDFFYVDGVPAFGTVHFNGGPANDTLYGPDSSTVWNIIDNNIGNINDKVYFSSVENLSGGLLPDRYKFSPGKHIDGGIDEVGDGMNDSLDYGLFLFSSVSVNLHDFSATGTPSFAGIEYVYGGSHPAQIDEIIGPNVKTVGWWMTGDHSGKVEWMLNGHSRRLDFFGIDSLIGGSGARNNGPLALAGNRLYGPNTSNVWDVTGPTSGVLHGTLFANMDTLYGGSQTDRFALRHGVSFAGNMDGGAGNNDEVSYLAWSSPATINMQKHHVGIETIWGGSSFSDVLVGASLDNDWDILNNGGYYSGRLNSAEFYEIENIVGGSKSDTFSFYHSAFTPGTIDGGGGIDTLDYSNYGSFNGNDVTVNLTTQQATGTNGILGIENVNGGNGNDTLTGNASDNLLRGRDGNDVLSGGAGNDVLVGGAGVDTLYGELGRDVLIGGGGSDTLFGGADDDILIGGRTSYDALDTKLNQIREIWARTSNGNSYSERIANLFTGPVSKLNPVKLNATTVLNDSAVDSLWSGDGLDWFWGNAQETKDLTPKEQLNIS